MAKFENRKNYRKKSPCLTEEIIEVLEKSNRKMECFQYDLKAEKCRIDYTKRTVTYIPDQEDSYERLLEENRKFADENMEDAVVKAAMIEKLLNCLRLNRRNRIS